MNLRRRMPEDPLTGEARLLAPDLDWGELRRCSSRTCASRPHLDWSCYLPPVT